jgi:iron(III) transport system substrate-binding protein
VIVQATASWAVDKSAAGFFTKFVGPAVDNPDYDKASNVSANGDYLVASAAVLTFGWNTDQYSKGLKDYPDLLDPELKGQIGVIEPTVASIVDFWLYLEGKFGKDFTDKLAAQNPKIYQSSLPMGQALASGEISAGNFVQVQTDAKKTGAPVDSGLSDTVWGALFQEAVLAKAPHPNAAQLLANYIITEPGQEAIAHLAGSVLPDIEGSVTTTDKVHKQDLSVLTPDAVAAYQARWNGLFKK